ncbi:hypothetical protein C0Q70_09819 [Pomacea canaliculata]|uniref:Uncharacterized protein n=1 Tax=Pomacea canaliculata TaxID=400727 RepID=A0A2T7PAW7_POMCA|nr:hypothetical protein C0Q70_09819 [Pomacea canaliculata]
MPRAGEPVRPIPSPKPLDSLLQEGDENRYDAGSPEAQKAVKAWVDYQDGQKILLTTPTVLVGLPSEGVPCRGHHAVVHSRHPVLQPHHQGSVASLACVCM